MNEEKSKITFDDFYKLDLRVAKVIWAGQFEGADRLLKLTLDVGELGERTIVSGIKPFYDPKDLINKRVVYLANLEPKKIRGVLSQGMLLAASPFDEEKQEYGAVLILPDSKVKPGTILR